MPGYAIQWIEIEGPFYDDPAGGAGYERLFDRLRLVPSKQARSGVPLEIVPSTPAGPGPAAGAAPAAAPRAAGIRARRRARGALRSRIRGAAGGCRAAVAIVPEEGLSPAGRRGRRAAVPAVVRRSIPAGLRLHPVDALGLHGRPVVAGLRVRRGEAGPARRYALATRLALFLWNSVPDDTLRALADRGELNKPDVLRAQAERMLDDPKARRFVEAFTDYWLDLRKIDDTSPSTTLYNDYELDDPLKLAALEETRLFFAELLRADLPARTRRRFGLHVPERAAGRPLRHRRRLRRPVPQGEAAGRQPPRRGDDAGQRPQGDRQRHDDLAGAARPLDHRADPGAGDAAPAADGQGRRAGYPRRGDDPPAVGEAPRRRELRLLPSARWTRRASRWRAST